MSDGSSQPWNREQQNDTVTSTKMLWKPDTESRDPFCGKTHHCSALGVKGDEPLLASTQTINRIKIMIKNVTIEKLWIHANGLQKPEIVPSFFHFTISILAHGGFCSGSTLFRSSQTTLFIRFFGRMDNPWVGWWSPLCPHFTTSIIRNGLINFIVRVHDKGALCSNWFIQWITAQNHDTGIRFYRTQS